MRDRIGRSLRLEAWAQGDSALHRRDARAKIGCALVLLVAIAATRPGDWAHLAPVGVAVVAGVGIGQLPLAELLRRGMVILPFPLVFAVVSWLERGDAVASGWMLARSYLSALVVLLLVGVTPMPELLRGLRGVGVPAVLVMILQSLLRYVQVVAEQGMRMRRAAACRDGARLANASRQSLWRRASGALAVLFGRSYSRAEGVHRAMLARGFQGEFLPPRPVDFAWPDWALVLGTGIGIGAMRWWWV